jgi:hypothetical protein
VAKLLNPTPVAEVRTRVIDPMHPPGRHPYCITQVIFCAATAARCRHSYNAGSLKDAGAVIVRLEAQHACRRIRLRRRPRPRDRQSRTERTLDRCDVAHARAGFRSPFLGGMPRTRIHRSRTRQKEQQAQLYAGNPTHSCGWFARPSDGPLTLLVFTSATRCQKTLDGCARSCGK